MLKHNLTDWRADGLRYHSLAWHWRQTFGQRVWKVTVDAGLGCPNRDGLLGYGGCVFCDPASFSPARRSGVPGIATQIELAAAGLKRRTGAERFVAYFQPGSNTYGPVDRLAAAYDEALRQPGVVGLAIGTRPDCLGDDVLGLLADLNRRTWLMLEIGVQSLCDASLRWIGRGHDARASVEAIARAKGTGLRVGAHVILGLPGETLADMLATAEGLAAAGINAVKLHNLYAVRNTKLGELVQHGNVTLPSQEEYISFVVAFLERLPGHIVIDRLSGDAPPEYLVGPTWCLHKAGIRQAIDDELRHLDTWQGRLAPE